MRHPFSVLLEQFHYFKYHDDFPKLQKQEYYAELRDLVWLNRVESTELRQSFQGLETNILHMKEQHAHTNERLGCLEARMSALEQGIMDLKDMFAQGAWYSSLATIRQLKILGEYMRRPHQSTEPPPPAHSSPLTFEYRYPNFASQELQPHYHGSPILDRTYNSSPAQYAPWSRQRDLHGARQPGDLLSVTLNRIRMVRDGLVSFPGSYYSPSPS